MKAALDAGHGSSRGRPFTGAAANGLVEDVIAFDLVRRIGHHLRAKGHQALYTRPGPALVALSARAQAAKAGGCDVFLSIHCNAGPPSARGVEAFAVRGDECSRRIARSLVQAVAGCGTANRGARWDTQSGPGRLKVLRDTWRSMPAVLLEVGFLTNAADARRLGERRYREAVAVAVAASLCAQQGT